MYDVERLGIIIRDIEKFFLELEKIGLDKKNLDNPEKFYASSMLIFTILNRMLDLSTEILVKNKFGVPSSYSQYFDVLEKKEFLGREIAKRLKEITKFRNLFAHQYFNMEKEEILIASKKIYAVKEFIEIIKRKLKIK